MLNWRRLLTSARQAPVSDRGVPEVRTQLEIDRDRILFSSVFRRLEDKTQVFPLQSGGQLRNRLTHSHEVSVLARSVVASLPAQDLPGLDASTLRHFLGLIEAISLAHDLGNPPFGHKGEKAISSWFAGRGSTWIPAGMEDDFLNFDGNAQTFRILTRVPSVSAQSRGMNLCASTLAGIVKYPSPLGRKRSYFAEDAEIYSWARAECGLERGERHPATAIMEACDDVAYLVADVEDCLTAGLFEVQDVFDALRAFESSEALAQLEARVMAKHGEFVTAGLAPATASRMTGPYFRSMAIAHLLRPLAGAFGASAQRGDFGRSLLDLPSPSTGLWRSLKAFGSTQIYGHAQVSASEARGIEAIGEALDLLSTGRVEDIGGHLPLEVMQDFVTGPIEARHLVDAVSLMTDHQVVDFAEWVRRAAPGIGAAP